MPQNVEPTLTAMRLRLFGIILNRLRQLHRSQPPPAAFYIGQSYIEDTESVECTIGAHFIFPGQIPGFEFRQHGSRVTGTQHQNILKIEIHRRISKQLWEDLKYLHHGERFVVAYLTTLMPRINKALVDNRYDQGHLLSRTFAVFEATVLYVAVKSEFAMISWPPAFPPFPPSAATARTIDALFVRDLIDAMGSYFRGEFDDCIRRLITSTENLVQTNGWNVSTIQNNCFRKFLHLKPRRLRLSIRQSLYSNLNKSTISGEVIFDNLLTIYSTRNSIVHRGLRMSPSSGLFCSKAIGTVYYLIYRHCGSETIRKYTRTLHAQFQLLCAALGSFDLDQIKRTIAKNDRDDHSIIDSSESLEFQMFTSLRFTEQDRYSISH